MYDMVREKIKDAQMVLVGLGEEFDDLKACKTEPGYTDGRIILEKSDKTSFLPAYDEFYRGKRREDVKQALMNLADLIHDKNYYVVTTSVNPVITECFDAEHITAPCGSILRKQCIHGCAKGMQKLSQEEKEKLDTCIAEYANSKDLTVFDKDILGICPSCGEKLILNNIYTEFYDENGYLDSWKTYHTWLQQTMNRNVVILELGVGLQCPTVIRFPFEKMAFYNQKASFFRIHENLYQMTEDLQGKGVSISKNSIDWLKFLC